MSFETFDIRPSSDSIKDFERARGLYKATPSAFSKSFVLAKPNPGASCSLHSYQADHEEISPRRASDELYVKPEGLHTQSKARRPPTNPKRPRGPARQRSWAFKKAEFLCFRGFAMLDGLLIAYHTQCYLVMAL